MLFEEEVRYPENGDAFFKDTGENSEIAWLQKTFQELGSYADSYQIGAIRLLDAALKEERLRDFLIYPSVFLIRHYIELRLKELLQGLKYCSEQSKVFPTHHDIQTLWGEFKKAYASFGQNSNDERFHVIDGLIKELSNTDPISMSFRYPVDKSGNKTQKLEFINLNILRETFIRICFVLDGVFTQIAHYVDLTEDMMRHAYQDY